MQRRTLPVVRGSSLLASAPPGWAYDRVELPSDDELVVRFSSTASRDWVEVRVSPLGAPGPVFKRLRHCQVRYRASVAQTGAEGREAVAALVLGIALGIDERLAAQPRASIATVLGRRDDRRVVVFTAESLRQLLVPWIVEGIAVQGGFTLTDVYPASRTSLRGPTEEALVLDFEHAADGERALFCVGPHVEALPGFARSAHLQLDHVTMGRPVSAKVETLRAFVAFVLQLVDHAGLTFRFGGEALAATVIEAEDAAGPGEVLNLAISAECGQSCAFCSVKSTAPAFDGGDETFAALANDLAREARRGVRAFRLNGYDPLAYSRVVDVARLATSLGYERVEVFSPATRLADPVFARELFDALPPARELYVPLYGTRAEVHDAVVGAPGSFDRVQKALAVARDLPGTKVALLSVVTVHNAGELYALARFAEARGLPISAHAPYPSFESRADRYFESAPRQSDVARAFFAEHARAPKKLRPLLVAGLLEGIAPCVQLRAASRAGVPLSDWLVTHEGGRERAPQALPGTEYRDERYRQRAGDAFSAATEPCPHATRCALRPVCAGALLRSYVALHGASEIEPVSVATLVAEAARQG